MKPFSLENLEKRVFFDVTLTNGLTPGEANYYEVTLGNGGGTRDVILGSTDTVYDYFAYVDSGVPSVGIHQRVRNLFTIATEPVDTGNNTARSVSTVAIPNPGLVSWGYSVEILSAVLPGQTRLTTTYNFASFGGFDLTTLRFFQYLDSDVAAVSDDVLTVEGTVVNNDLVLGTIDPTTLINAAQRPGTGSAGAILTGWAADEFAALQNDILTGAFDADVNGSIDLVALPPGNFPGIGPGFGPEDVTTALEYQFQSIVNASIQTVLGTTLEGVNGPVIEVLGNGLLIDDGDTTPSLNDLTNFGTLTAPVTQTFVIRNRGTATLSLNSNPTVQIVGDAAADFSIVLQPTEFVGAGFTSSFQIRFNPTNSGLRAATVLITSNDTNSTLYDFAIQAGSGAAIAQDVFENDNESSRAGVIGVNGVAQNRTIHASNDVDWATFTVANTSNVVVETNGGAGDTVLQLYGPDTDKVLLTSDDNSGNRDFSRIERVLEPGQYWARVSENGSNARIATYTLSVSATDVNPTPFAFVDAFGTLNINGTELADEIRVTQATGNLQVIRNGTPLFFANAGINRLYVTAGDGNDLVIIGAGVPATMVIGSLGNDVIVGGDANDSLFGGQGDDYIQGGGGNDFIVGRDGNDTLFGQTGNDSIYGTDGNDSIQGGQGNDSLFGELGNDRVYGLVGDDRLGGGKGSDSLDGGGGNDNIVGGLGLDFLTGGAGNDILFARDNGIDTVDGSDGSDSAQIDDLLDTRISIESLIA